MQHVRRLRPVLRLGPHAEQSITLKRNPYYKGPRPHNVDRSRSHVGNSLEVIQQNVESGSTDYAAGGIPPTAWTRLAQKYGVNKGRVFVNAAARRRRTSR